MSSAGSANGVLPPPPPPPPLPMINIRVCYDFDLAMLNFAADLSIKAGEMYATDREIAIFIQAQFDLAFQPYYWHCIVNGELTHTSPIWEGSFFAKFQIGTSQIILYKTIATAS